MHTEDVPDWRMRMFCIRKMNGKVATANSSLSHPNIRVEMLSCRVLALQPRKHTSCSDIHLQEKEKVPRGQKSKNRKGKEKKKKGPDLMLTSRANGE